MKKIFNEQLFENKSAKKIIMFLTIFLVLNCYFLFGVDIQMDEIWNFGFSYNIANGLIPYKNFNMVILPFYQMIIAFFLKIFGKNLFIYHIVNSLIISGILTCTSKDKFRNTFLVLIFLLLILIPYGYNMFVSVFLILILYLENSDYKYKNEIIGFIIGSIFMTKQNLGVFIFIPYFIFSKHKIKSILHAAIIPIFILIYLVYTNSLFDCINYCFLGLSNFQDNLIIYWPILITECVLLILLFILYLKTRDKNYIYLIAFQSICYPLFDYNHFFCGILPIVYYVSNYTSTIKFNKGIMNNLFAFFKVFGGYFGVFLFVSTIICTIENTGINIVTENNYMKYRNLSSSGNYRLQEITKYIENNPQKKVFIISHIAYGVKLSLNISPNKFDLLNKGNMGEDENLYIDELDKICQDNECVFIIDLVEFDKKGAQISPIFKDYVLENYDFCEQLTNSDSVYCKEKIDSLEEVN